MADDSYVEPHAPAMQTKEERDRRIAELSSARGEEWARAFVEGAAAYRAAFLREFQRHGDPTGALDVADHEMRRRFGEAFDRAVKERGHA